MNEIKIPAPPILAIPPEPEPSGGDSGAPSRRMRQSQQLRTAHRALFTASSYRRELVAAYPELDLICTHLGFDVEVSIGEWNADPTRSLLILARSAHAPPPTAVFDWSQAEIFELIDDLIDHHHCPLRNELRRLGLLVRHFDQAHLETRTLDFDGAFAKLEINLIEHIDHEENLVFPHCLANESAARGALDGNNPAAEVTSDIREMMSGHDYGTMELSHLLNQVDTAIGMVIDGDLGVIRLGLQAMAADLIVHVEKERDILTPAAIFSEDLLRAKRNARTAK